MAPERTISMNGAAWLASFILSFSSREAWIENRMKSGIWPDKTETIRAGMLAQVWTLAGGEEPKEPVKKKK
jgi:hypothetical protein